MRVLVVRHAQAVPAGTRDLRDADRPLTPEGEERFRAAARFITRILPRPDVLLASPLVRARQTATLLADAWGEITPELEPVLASGGVETVIAMLGRYPRGATVALVGHEPTMSTLLGQLLGVISSEAIRFDPGAAALLEIASLERASASLRWFLPPDVAP